MARSREQFDVLGSLTRARAEYDAVRDTRYVRRPTGYAATGSSADYHYRSEADFLKLIEFSRYIDRNTLAGAMVDRVVANIVRDGLTIDPQSGDKQLDAALWDYWQAFASNPQACDVTGQRTFAHLTQLVTRALLVDGDLFAVLTGAGPIQAIEAHRCRTPSGTKKNVVHGVLLDELRRPVQYWFTGDDVDPMVPVKLVGQMQIYAAYDAAGQPQVLHLRDERRITQTRGVSRFAGCYSKFSMLDDLQFAKLVQSIAVSCFTLMHNPSTTPPPVGGGGASAAGAKGERSEQQLSDGRKRQLEGLVPALEVWAEAGETIQAFSPNVPNAEYLPFALSVLQEIAAAINLPLIALLLDATKTNFSGWRGAVDQAKIGWKQTQALLRDRWVLPTYRHEIRVWAQRDPALARALQRTGKIDAYRCEVGLPKWPYIQPEIEAEADAKIISAGLNSPRRVLANRGEEHETVHTERVQDFAFVVRQAVTTAEELRKETGLRVDPMQLVNLDPTRALTLPDSPPEAQSPAQRPDSAATLQVVSLRQTGQIDAGAAETLLVSQGHTPEDARRIVSGITLAETAAQPLNGAQIDAALKLCESLANGTLGTAAVTELLVGLGLPRDSAERVSAGVPANIAQSAAALAFARDLLKLYAGNQQAAAAIFNRTDVGALLLQAGITQYTGYEEPYLAIVAPAGQVLTGEVVRDDQGAVVGGAVEDPASETAPADGETKPPADESEGGDGETPSASEVSEQADEGGEQGAESDEQAEPQQVDAGDVEGEQQAVEQVEEGPAVQAHDGAQPIAEAPEDKPGKGRKKSRRKKRSTR